MKLPKISLVVAFLGLLHSSLLHAQDATPSPKVPMMIKDGELVPEPTPAGTAEPQSLYHDAAGAARIKERLDQLSKKYGSPALMIPAPETPDPNVITNFELPPEQIIPNCTYAGGATFPDDCTDDEDNLIFEAGRDPQSTLDAIKDRYGITGEYNVVPPGYKAKTPYDDEIDRLQLGTPE